MTPRESSAVKIAYLIFAHTDPPALAELVDALISHDPNAHIFIHVDGSVAIEPFRAACMGSDRTMFASGRIRVSWCGYSFLRAQVELLRMALNQKPQHIERFVFLSGLDFPIVNPHAISQRLADRENRLREFVGGANITRSSLDSARWRINRYHLFRDAQIPRWIKRIVMKLARDLAWALGISKPVQATLAGRRVDVYTGSDWIAVTRGFGEHILEVFDNDKPFTSYFRFSFCPTEMFYHTILNNSTFLSPGDAADLPWHCAPVDDLPSLTPLHFIDYTESIRVLDASDLPRLIASEKPFARKLATGRSDALRSLIRLRWSTTHSDRVPPLS
jgi:hypothetical protein